MELFTIVAASVGILVASFFSTVSGFGFALVAMPFLTLVIPVKAAIIFIIAINLLLRLVNMYQVRRDFDWQTVLLTTAGSLLGMVPGSLVLRVLSGAQLQVFLGIVLLTATLLLSLQCTVKITHRTVGRIGAGMLAGFFGASTSVNGPPLALYFLNEQTPKELMRANLIWFFGLSGICTILTNYLAGNTSEFTQWQLLLCCLPTMLLGIWLGERFFHRLNQQLFRRLSLIVVLAGSLSMLYNGLRNL